MQKAIAKHEWMRGRLRLLESHADELENLRRQLMDRKEELRTIGLTLRSENRSIYIRRRLDGFLSALKRLDGLEKEEAGIYRDMQKYIGRLLNTDLVDHFSRSLHRRVGQITRSEIGPRVRTDVTREPLWYRLNVGGIQIALHGRLRRVQHSKPQAVLRLKPGSMKSLRIFPVTSALTSGATEPHRYTAIFETSASELAVIHCDGLSVLPSLFRPEDATPVLHPDLAGRMRYGGSILYLWKPGEIKQTPALAVKEQVSIPPLTKGQSG